MDMVILIAMSVFFGALLTFAAALWAFERVIDYVETRTGKPIEELIQSLEER